MQLTTRRGSSVGSSKVSASVEDPCPNRVAIAVQVNSYGAQTCGRGSSYMLGLSLLSSPAAVSEYCTKEQTREGVRSSRTLPVRARLLNLRDSILVQETMWFDMNYPKTDRIHAIF